MVLTLILGNQLHREWLIPSPLQLDASSQVLMIEDLGVASLFAYHKLRLLHTFVAMRHFRDALLEQGVAVHYFELPNSERVTFWERLGLVLDASAPCSSRRELRIAEIPDPGFQTSLENFCGDCSVSLVVLPSPAFLNSAQDSQKLLSGRKRPFMKSFYEQQRQRLGVLIDPDGNPTGGRWSYDTENRRKLPKGYVEPPLPEVATSSHEADVRRLIQHYFADNPGQFGSFIIPFDHPGSQQWLVHFLQFRLHDFGPYEDALSSTDDVLHHSLLSPLLNIGLLSPADVLSQTLVHARNMEIPIASLEGFLRQVIGWREFIRGIHLQFGERQAKENFWGHQRTLNSCWSDGTTGLPPLDRAIERVNRLAYTHHIERLMVISNLMLLCEIHPEEVYRWFMERYIDSYEWVMGPNVYGMGQMSDGGIFATKPYICSSNYILKMGGGPRGSWCEIWDGLYWRFIHHHRRFFRSNPRLSMMVALLDRMDHAKRENLFDLAERFISRVTTDPG